MSRARAQKHPLEELQSLITRLVRLNARFWYDLSNKFNGKYVQIIFKFNEAQKEAVKAIQKLLREEIVDYDRIISYLPLIESDIEKLILEKGKQPDLDHKLKKCEDIGADYTIIFLCTEGEDGMVCDFLVLPFKYGKLLYYSDPYQSMLELLTYLRYSHPCAHCGKEDADLECEICGIVYYCDDECCWLNRKQHMPLCTYGDD